MATKKDNWTDIENYRNTEHTYDNGHTCTLYSTEIFRFDYIHSTLTLRHGGHTTATTKRRMNECLRACDLRDWGVYQEDRVWYVSTPAGDFEFDGTEMTFDVSTGKPA